MPQQEQCAVITVLRLTFILKFESMPDPTSCGWTGAKNKGKAAAANGAETTIFDETLKCAMCMELCNRPITVLCLS